MAVQPVSTASATARANTIRGELGALTLTAGHIETQLAKAYKLKDWEALGYPDWAAYCQGEYGTHLAKLGAGLRTMMRTELTMAGASVGEIAAACGVNRKTIQRDMHPAATNVAPERQQKATAIRDQLGPMPSLTEIRQRRIELTAGQDQAAGPPATADGTVHQQLARQRNAQIRQAAIALGYALDHAPPADDSRQTTALLHSLFVVLRDRLAPGGPVAAFIEAVPGFAGGDES